MYSLDVPTQPTPLPGSALRAIVIEIKDLITIAIYNQIEEPSVNGPSGRSHGVRIRRVYCMIRRRFVKTPCC